MEAHQSQRGVVEYTYSINPNTDDIQPIVTLQQGKYLNEFSCNDAIMNDPEVLTEYRAISGTVAVTAVADGEVTDWGEAPASMLVTFSNVCFNTPEAFCVEEWSVEAFVGWMPG